VGAQPDWSILLAVFSSQLGDEIVLQRCQLSPIDPATSDTDGDGESTAIASIIVAGIGLTQQAVSQYVLDLQQLRLFRSIRLVDTKREPYLDGHAIAFRIECTLGTDGQGSSETS
ncbi:MAG: hypothetical protein ACYTGC_18155, partial [Planctomycetota bacterium]